MSKAAELAKLIGDGTFGTGVAEDKKIVFDGNAQDYHIGLDDSTDSLTIGKGTALGTTPHIVSNASGHVTLPSTPGFCVVGSPSKDGNNDLHSFQSVKFNLKMTFLMTQYVKDFPQEHERLGPQHIFHT